MLLSDIKKPRNETFLLCQSKGITYRGNKNNFSRDKRLTAEFRF